MSNKKITLSATRTRETWGQWKYRLQNSSRSVTACHYDVNALFFGVNSAYEADFIITTRRPRVYNQYHRFNWTGASYATTEETTGDRYYIVQSASEYIYNRMGRAKTIYVSIEV